ncbi:hypothetical protein P168DRAFT_323129 [Aspergillus campestris IBT 28561]|uniref:Uncharacterized protein n=1 Tax=Aspergillus campestris (strain IBT 28561) TaxID=1392248 RepID=A0A2I1DDH9_ASPC2|nr:uncharacterized protein P168DRAFT_323129 [Aspergillus campestris IBT 28561]PKY07924.1 hypothetical protein P168DRAFT_323129 [Aspergillus campestris IBT 28561]
MKLLSVIFLACATAVMAQRGPGEPCAAYPGAFCNPGLKCEPNHPGLPGGQGHCVPDFHINGGE